MTVSTEPTQLSYDGDDSTDEFPVTWNYFAKSHVVATLRDSSGTETTWVLDTDYTLTDADLGSGTLTATTNPATGETLIIDLDPPNTQEESLPIGGSIPIGQIENALDQAAQRSAKLEALFNRAMLVPTSDTQVGSLAIPIDSTRASKFLAFDSNGAPMAAVGTSADLGPVSAYIDTLLDDADAATARATLEAAGLGVNVFTGTQKWAKGADIASANALALGTDGNYFDVTGTTAITSIGTLGVGTIVKLHFDGILTLTHHSTNLILPGDVDISTEAGAEAELFEYATGDWRLLNYTPASGAVYPVGYKEGLTFAINSTDSAHDIDVAVGRTKDAADSVNLILSSILIKQIDATFAAGTNAGGMFTGSVGNSTRYYVHLIRKDSDGTIDAGYDTSATAANIPSGYTAYRKLGSVLTDGSANLDSIKIEKGLGNPEYYESNQYTVTQAGALTLTHGLSGKPRSVELSIICITTDQNYSVDDELLMYHGAGDIGASDGTSTVPDATTLNIRYGNLASVFYALNKTTGSQSALTNAKWEAKWRAEV